jgi:hypothetical protein
VSAQGGCIPLTRYALSKTRAMGPYGASVYLSLLRLAPEYGTAFTVSHADLVTLSGTSYQTVRKSLGVLSDLELLTVAGKRVNGSDPTGMFVTMHRVGCGLKCENTCGKPVDNSASLPVENSDEDSVTMFGVTYEDTALPTGLARAKEKAQVNDGAVTSGDTAGPGGGKPTPSLIDRELDLSLGLEGLTTKKSHKKSLPDPRVQEVFDAWVSFTFDGRHLTQHKGITENMAKKITKALAALDRSHGNGSAEELAHAIANYGRCLLDPKCAWSYSWTLTDFMGRGNGYERFLDEANPVERETNMRASLTSRSPAKASSANGFASARERPFRGL